MNRDKFLPVLGGVGGIMGGIFAALAFFYALWQGGQLDTFWGKVWGAVGLVSFDQHRVCLL